MSPKRRKKDGGKSPPPGEAMSSPNVGAPPPASVKKEGESSSSPTAEENGSNGVEVEEVAAVNGNGDAGGASSGAAAMEQVEVEEGGNNSGEGGSGEGGSGDGDAVCDEALADEQYIEYIPKLGPRNTWLACDLCGKWRRLGKMKDKDLPEQWTCDQNTYNLAYASCEADQELPDDEIDRLLGLLPPKPKEEKEKKEKTAEQIARKLAAECAGMPGAPPPVCGKSLGEVMDQLLEKAKLPVEEARAIHWHLANLEYGCATGLHNVSLSWWDQDDGNDFGGDHVVIQNGFDKMVKGLSNYLEVLLEREVSSIEHNATGVRVHTKGGGDGIEADAVLITVPLGVLKAKTIGFNPPLPPWKRHAIDRLGFGPIEKVVLLFEKRFWEEGVDFFGCLPPSEMGEKTDELTSRRGEFFLFWNLERSHGIPALICISSGQFADKTWRQHSYKGVVNKALAVLRRTFGTQVTSTFKRSVVSDWGRNPYARGSYSYVAVGGSGRDYDECAWPVGVNSTRLFFAGEHTNGQHPATATGAFISGLREAQRIDECVRNGFAPAPAE